MQSTTSPRTDPKTAPRNRSNHIRPAVLISFRASTETTAPISRTPKNKVKKPSPRATSCDLVRSSNQRAALGYATAATTSPITRDAKEINSWVIPLMAPAITEPPSMAAKSQSSQFHAPIILSAKRVRPVSVRIQSSQKTIRLPVLLTRFFHHLGRKGRWGRLLIPVK